MTFEQDSVHTVRASKIEERIVFSLVFVGVFCLTYGFFFVIDFLPEKPDASNERDTIVAIEEVASNEEITALAEEPDSEPVAIDPLPIRIIFDSLEEREVAVINPESRSVDALDTALLSGVVRHPDSADFERVGTIFLFGHSSYLPNVINKNFQAFNGIQKLTWGDTIRLHSSDTEYVYRVDRVYEASADDAEVKIESGKAKLTLVTCDSFGSKSDRFIVEASLIESRPRG
jgi:LPXTG-site transpeptidase (sortase) family protein